MYCKGFFLLKNKYLANNINKLKNLQTFITYNILLTAFAAGCIFLDALGINSIYYIIMA